MAIKDADGDNPAVVAPVVLTFAFLKIIDPTIDPTFTNVNRLFVLPFTRTDIRDYRNAFWNYYVPDAEIKDFDVLIDGKSFFDLPLKMKKKLTEKVLKWVTIMIIQLAIY